MNHIDHVDLITDGIHGGGTWADLGAGRGAFTLALADVAGDALTIYAVDKDRGALNTLKRTMEALFPAADLLTVQADFSQLIDLPPLDGVIMANALHFCEDKLAVLAHVRAYLRPGGQLVVVEYDTDSGNRWVPYPFSYATWQMLAAQAGFTDTRLLKTRKSDFMGRFYAAASTRP